MDMPSLDQMILYFCTAKFSHLIWCQPCYSNMYEISKKNAWNVTQDLVPLVARQNFWAVVPQLLIYKQKILLKL